MRVFRNPDTVGNYSLFSEIAVGQTFTDGDTIFMKLDSNFSRRWGAPAGINAIRLSKANHHYPERLHHFDDDFEVENANDFALVRMIS